MKNIGLAEYMYSASCRFHVLGNLHNDSLTVILHFAEYAKSAAVVCLLHVIGKPLPNSRIRQSSCRLHVFGNILPITRIRQVHQLGVTYTVQASETVKTL
jgi:hypothetical protein